MKQYEILGTRYTVKGLCGLARQLGYVDSFHQLANSDGTVVGDFLCFLEDNPGACEAVIDWAFDNFKTLNVEADDDEDFDDEEDGEVSRGQ